MLKSADPYVYYHSTVFVVQRASLEDSGPFFCAKLEHIPQDA